MQAYLTLQGYLGMTFLISRKKAQSHLTCMRFKGFILLHMHTLCRAVEDSYQGFNETNRQNLLLWNAKIADFVEHGHADEAIKLFLYMEDKRVTPNLKTLLSILKACANLPDLEMGKQIHDIITLSEVEPSAFINGAIVDMYIKCGSVEDARQVFDKMPDRDVVSWNAMITAYVKHGFSEDAFNLYQLMGTSKTKPNDVTFVSSLNGCARLKELEWGRQIHADVVKSEVEPNVFIYNTLIDMYSKSGSTEDARQVFRKMPNLDVVSWNVMIAGYGKHGSAEEAFELFQQMKSEGFQPNEITILHILNACTRLGNLEHGKQIHAHIEKTRMKGNSFLNNALVDMYAKCGSINDAQVLFERLPKLDVVSWNAMITGHTKLGHTAEALTLYERMKQEGITPTEVTFLSICHVCGSLADLERAKEIHAHILKSGTPSNTLMGNALVDMYAKCGSLEDAQQVFDKLPEQDVISWTAIIAGYVQRGQHDNALNLFNQMQWEGVKPNEVTFLTLLNASASLGNMEKGKQIHCHMISLGIKPNLTMLNTLMDMYAKCGNLKNARGIFDEIPRHDIVSWNVMITGYARYGHAEEALKLFAQMEGQVLKADEVTFVGILNACASLAALEKGKHIHEAVVKSGFDSSVFVGSALIDMYVKCGSLSYAHQVLDKMSERDVASWTAIIAGYAQHGHGKKALQLVHEMQREGVKLNHITMISILSACSHAGLVNEGCYFYNSMGQDNGIKPMPEHYACMVDLLGRAGRLEEADDFIQKLPNQPTATLWMALLGACRMYCNVNLAKHAAEMVLQLEPYNAAAFLLLSNIYASLGMWEDNVELIKLMKYRGVRRGPGWCQIEVNNQSHVFSEGELHPQIEQLYAELNRSSWQMKEAGYVPDTDIVMENAKDQKEFYL